jgi:hypothetical protein
MGGVHEYGNEPALSIKGEEFLNQLREYQRLKNNSNS